MDNARDASAEKRELDPAKPLTASEPAAATPEELEITRSFLSIAFWYDREAEDREADDRDAKRWGMFLAVLLAGPLVRFCQAAGRRQLDLVVGTLGAGSDYRVVARAVTAKIALTCYRNSSGGPLIT